MSGLSENSKGLLVITQVV